MVNVISEVCNALQKVSLDPLLRMAHAILTETHYNDAKIWLVGNGGSSATMSHLCSDLHKLGIMAICLTDNIPALTAETNDSGWEQAYVALVADKVKPGDILIIASVNGSAGLSPDGESWSSNLLELAFHFKQKFGSVFAFIGNNGGYLVKEAYLSMVLESKNPYVVESVHSVWAHALVSEIKQIMESEEIDVSNT